MLSIDTQFVDTISKILSDYVSHSEITRMGEVLGYPKTTRTLDSINTIEFTISCLIYSTKHKINQISNL